MRADRTRTKVGEGGRVVIPAAYRRALDLEAGDEVVVVLEDGEIRIMKPQQAIRRAQRAVREYVDPDYGLADSLIRDRRREAEDE